MNVFATLLDSDACREGFPSAFPRKKIWEVEQFFRCAVAGMCLSVGEQRQLCRRVGAAVRAKSDFAIHEMLVATMDGENPLSSRLDRFLARKYEGAFGMYLSMPEAEFLEHWHGQVQKGDYAGLLWAAAVRCSLSHVAMVDVFGSLHMAMHEHARAYRGLVMRIAAHEKKMSHIKSRVKTAESGNKILAADNSRLRQSVSLLQTTLDQERRQPVPSAFAPKGDQAGGPALGAMAEFSVKEIELACALDVREGECAELREALRSMEQKYAQLQEDFSVQMALAATLRQTFANGKCSPECPSYDLCKKRILIVGGIERMESAYRKLVEERGGIFEYHAGHMKSGGKALENSVQRADLVLCPVNCNSHGACLMVKNLGKKYKKPVHMLSNFSLSAVAKTVTELHGSN